MYLYICYKYATLIESYRNVQNEIQQHLHIAINIYKTKRASHEAFTVIGIYDVCMN